VNLVLLNANADEKLWPTELYTGECVSDRLLASRNEFVEKIDYKYCNDRNVGKPDKIQNCLNNSQAHKKISFFTDRCGSVENTYFISLNGIEHKVKRVTPLAKKQLYLTGNFEGEGLKIKITQGRLIRKIYEEGSKRTEDDVVDAEYEVMVVVTKDNQVEKIKGTLLYGR
jgi:hypothetical protein